MGIMNSFIDVIFKKLAYEASKLTTYNKKNTMSSRGATATRVNPQKNRVTRSHKAKKHRFIFLWLSEISKLKIAQKDESLYVFSYTNLGS
ncbi:hypothetical protein L1987_03350 [Smallanthus sonchifolius]|uniref:Uncharacterized protein n=1 Tax=Smallanthus sonchifolius TaxID=185202 RepID=A0ACB9KAF8_9ASTR|nr:hypothetical protein L1987_03350 [Smallanthus sonchifolius]